MASVFGHCVLGATLGKLLLPDRKHWRYWGLAAACAFLPDADVIGFKLHVPSASLWGHRGLTHSVLAAAVLASAVTGLCSFRRRAGAPAAGRLWLLLFLATASHGVLDALTTGGEGVAFYSPFHQHRYFFDFRPIQVSPIGIRKFAGEWAARVLKSEVLWIGLPCVVILLARRVLSGRIRRASL